MAIFMSASRLDDLPRQQTEINHETPLSFSIFNGRVYAYAGRTDGPGNR